jgi:hypothetical protein
MAAKRAARGTDASSGPAATVTPMDVWVGRARTAGALLGFLLGLWVCHRQGLGLVDSTLRALVAAAGLSLVAWWSALLAIQGLMRAAAAQREREREAALAAIAAARAEAAAAEGALGASPERTSSVPEAG